MAGAIMLDRRTLLWGALAMPAIGLARPARRRELGPGLRGQPRRLADRPAPAALQPGRGADHGRDHHRAAGQARLHHRLPLPPRQSRDLGRRPICSSFASRTDDNGTAHRVQARRSGDRILVEGDQGIVEAPGDALPTTYWHRRFLDRPQWIDTQGGRLLSCSVSPRGVERIAAVDREVAADRFAVAGDLQLDLWYVGEQWVKLAFPGPDGTPIDYRLQRSDRPPAATAS